MKLYRSTLAIIFAAVFLGLVPAAFAAEDAEDEYTFHGITVSGTIDEETVLDPNADNFGHIIVTMSGCAIDLYGFPFRGRAGMTKGGAPENR